MNKTIFFGLYQHEWGIGILEIRPQKIEKWIVIYEKTVEVYPNCEIYLTRQWKTYNGPDKYIIECWGDRRWLSEAFKGLEVDKKLESLNYTLPTEENPVVKINKT